MLKLFGPEAEERQALQRFDVAARFVERADHLIAAAVGQLRCGAERTASFGQAFDAPGAGKVVKTESAPMTGPPPELCTTKR